MIDVAAIQNAVVARITTDIEGASVRAVLGDGANSIIHAELLRNEGLQLIDLPTRPLIAYRRRVIPQVERVIYRPVYSLWIYDDPERGYYRINTLITLIVQAYNARLLSVATSAIGDVEISAVGGEDRDTALGLLYSHLQLIIGAV